MIVYYAMGGGLGHLTRAKAVIHTLNLAKPITLISASPYVMDKRIIDGCEIITPPTTLASNFMAFRQWLWQLLDNLEAQALYLDSFPGGILGELTNDFSEKLPIYYLARLLRWKRYSAILKDPLPQFEKTYLLEPLTVEQLHHIKSHSQHIQPLQLIDPPNLSHPPLPFAPSSQPLWLIIHAGPPDEIEQLIAYAEEISKMEKTNPKFMLIAPYKPSQLATHILFNNIYPALPYMALADCLITASGFNVMRQASKCGVKHYFMPFERQYDNQFKRAAWYRTKFFSTPKNENINHQLPTTT